MADADDPHRIRFSPSILPLHAPVEVDREAAPYPLPEGYLDGDFSEAVAAMLGTF